jgi:branched-chain amino acid transport system permease protein
MNVHGSGFVVMATLIGGGLVSFWGPVIGAVVFIVARDLLGALTDTWLLWYGLLFMGVVLFQPEGIAGAWQRYSVKPFRGARSVHSQSGRLSREAQDGTV